MNIADLLTARASAGEDKPAIIDDAGGQGRTVTFRELDRDVTRLAAHLRRLGLAPGDPVLVLQPVSLELCLLLVALLRAGLVAVFVDPSAGITQLDACCRTTRPRVFIGSGKAHWLRLLSRGLRSIPRHWRTRPLIRAALQQTTARPADMTRHDLPDDAPALVRFTSGSTGEPKAAVRTHGYLLAQMRAIETHLRLSPGQIDLVTMPMFMLPNLAAGVTSVLPAADVRAPGRLDAAAFLRQIKSRRPDRLTASPALLHRLVEHAAPRALTLDSLRHIDTGGAPVLPGLLDAVQRLAPRAAVTAVYGSTEAEPIALLPREAIGDADRHAIDSGAGLLAGTPVPDIAVRVIREDIAPPNHRLSDAEFDALALPPGKAGEIIVSGPHVHPGQSNDPALEPTKLFAGSTVWHRTGDAGRLDAASRLWLLGRSSARIDDARGSLHPFPIEAAVLAGPSIRHAAVIAIDGKRILAIEPADTASPPQLPDWVRAEIDEVRILRRLPLDRRHNAKVDYTTLRKLL